VAAVTPRPYTLIAELTYRCPLRCAYCSNPTDLATSELATDDWLRVFREAEALGVVQLHLTGGEPLLRRDLEALVRGGREAGLYVNLITSGVPLDEARLEALREAGLDHVQLSFQDVDPDAAEAIAGARVLDRKREAAGWIRALGLALTVNIVLHQKNIDRIDALLAFAESTGAERIELANARFLGWALLNRAALLPSGSQMAAARRAAAAARARLGERLTFVLPDYHSRWPRACMDGWARRTIVVSPGGLVLPCHAAHTIRGLELEDVRARPLGAIWADSPALTRFRGEAWMPEPCASCERRAIDFGGCRCQAYHLTGDAAATDPACVRAPRHELVELARAAGERPIVLRSRG
jgi:pyrroloquinoline quinone biosynthesis protein E